MKVKVHDQMLYIDEHLKNQLDKVKRRVNQKDEDYFFAVDGEEGSGKSVFAMQIACYLDPTFCLERVVFTPEAFQNAIVSASLGQVVLFDEAFRGLSSRGALSQVNKLLVQLMMECRAKNLMVLVVMPTFFLLDKYVALWRAKGLFHIYRNKGLRGYWMYFNKKKKRVLYPVGMKNYYSYAYPKSNFKGRFANNYLLDEDDYRRKKKSALEESFTHKPSERFQDQRNLLLWYLNRQLGVSTTKISSEVGRYGWKIGQPSVVKAIGRFEKEKLDEL